MRELLVKENCDGEAYIDLPVDVTERLGWKEGDEVEFVDNGDNTMTIRKTVPPVRYSHVKDSMYELDEECNEINKQYMHVFLPQYEKSPSPDGSLPNKFYQVEHLYIKMDPSDRTIYPCTSDASHKLQFKVVYNGSWAGNGSEYETSVMNSMTKPELLKIADEAMMFTENEHHCFLEALRFDHIDQAGVVHLKLSFGS